MPTPKKVAPKKAPAKAAKLPRSWPPPATSDDLLAWYRAGVESRPIPGRSLATMELARVLSFRGEAAEATALRESINQPGMRTIAMAEASLDEADAVRARALVDDAEFDHLEVAPADRTRPAAAVLFVALQRLGDPRAAERRPEITTGTQEPPQAAGYPFVEISRLYSVGASALCRVGETRLAIELCRSRVVRRDDLRALFAAVLTDAPDAAADLPATAQNHGDRLDLLQHGADVLAALGRYGDALAWIAGFPEVTFKDEAKRSVVRAALARGAPEAWGLWEASFRPLEAANARRAYPGDRPFESELAKWLIVGAEADPERVRTRLDSDVADMAAREIGKSGSLAATVVDLAEAATRAGVDTTALRAMGGALAACGVLRATDPNAPGFAEQYTEVTRGLKVASKAGRLKTEVVCALIEHLARVGRFDESRDLAETGEAMQVQPAEAAHAQARGGDLEGAFGTWTTLKKALRAPAAAPLFEAAIAQGNIAAVTALAKELPGDVEFAMPAVARALMHTPAA